MPWQTNKPHQPEHTTTPTPPPRIHILLAHRSPMAVIIRRGPSRRVCTLGWNRDTDEITIGQWMKGKLYPFRCDLSPNGRYFIYFAMNGKWHSETMGSWTAISRAPYLKAIALWPKGDCWNGGGLFLDRDRYWINGCHEDPITGNAELQRVDTHPLASGEMGECPAIYWPRLQRDGWTRGETCDVHNGSETTFDRPLPGGWILRKWFYAGSPRQDGEGCYVERHELIQPRGTSLPEWNAAWANFDGNRLMWIRDGQLYACPEPFDDAAKTTPLHDFRGMEFEPLKAPY